MNLSQNFSFETDDLKSFGEVLRPLLRVLFRDYGDYIKLHLFNKQPNSFDNGKTCYVSKPKVLPFNGTCLLVDRDKMVSGVDTLKVVGAQETLEEACAKVNDMTREKPVKPSYFWVTTLSDYKDSNSEDRTYFKNYNEMYERAMLLMAQARNFSKEEFEKVCGDGYNSCFNDNDGDIDVGFRMSLRHRGAFNILDLSLCHIYYGR